MNQLYESNTTVHMEPDTDANISESLGLVLGLSRGRARDNKAFNQDNPDDFSRNPNPHYNDIYGNEMKFSNVMDRPVEPDKRYPHFHQMNDATSTRKDSNQVNSINGISISDIELLYSAGLVQNLSQPQRFPKQEFHDDSHNRNSAITIQDNMSEGASSIVMNNSINNSSFSGSTDYHVGTGHDTTTSTTNNQRTALEFDPVALEREHQKVMEALAAVYASQSYCQTTTTSNHDLSSNSITMVNDDQYLFNSTQSKPEKKRAYKKMKDRDTSSSNGVEALCPICDGSYKNKSSLASHMKTHDTERKKYTCTVCQASFSRNHDLKRHEAIHNNTKPHVCDGCGRGFSRRDALKRHTDTMQKRPGGCSNLSTSAQTM